MPFDDQNIPQLISKLTNGEYNMRDPIWKKGSEEAKDLIDRMLTIDPSKRPNATQVLEHAWFAKDLSQGRVLQEVGAEFSERRNKKKEGKLNVHQMLKIENINEEILKKGLEIGSITHMKSMFNNPDSFFKAKPDKFLGVKKTSQQLKGKHKSQDLNEKQDQIEEEKEELGVSDDEEVPKKEEKKPDFSNFIMP